MNRTLVENQADKIIKGINFSAIMSCQVASKEDEFILVMVEHNTTYSYLYRAKYYPQRDLIVQIALLAKDVYDKRF